MLKRKIQGMSLLELLVVLSLVVLLSLVGKTAMTKVIASTQSKNEAGKIILAFKLARHEAMQTHQIVTLCLIENQQCVKEGALPLVVFYDSNNNRKIDDDEYIVRHFSSPTENSVLKIKASFGRAYFRFKADGSAMEVGSLIYCPKDVEAHGVAVTLNYMGRAYFVREPKDLKNVLSC